MVYPDIIRTEQEAFGMKQHSVPAPVLTVFLAAEGILYAAFLTLDVLGRSSETYALKYTGILLCLALSLLCAWLGGDKLVAPALMFTAAADWFLLIRNDHLMLGVALFLCVQTLYLLRLYRVSRRLSWGLRGILAVALLPALFPLKLATPLNLLAVFYFSQLLSNTILAWRHPDTRRFALGLTLFVGCDICVGLFNAVPLPSNVFSIVSIGMWFFYLPSQVLIALSAMPTKEVPHENK